MKKVYIVFLLFAYVNCYLGCYAYSQIKKEDTEKLEDDDKVKITTSDEKVYYLTNIELQDSILNGYTFEYEYKIYSYLKDQC